METLTEKISTITLDENINVGVFYHPDLVLHKPLKDHPERPERVTSIISRFESAGLLKKCKFYNDFQPVDPVLCSDIHGERYVEYVESLWDENSKKEVRYYTDTYYNKDTVRVAKLAVNAIITAVDEVLKNNLHRAFGVVRPPGHHAAAKSDRIQGFCIYNNVAVAAKYAIKKHNLKRVLIFDWDVHHGDSTSKLFYKDASILYISLHRYDHGEFYPQGNFGSMEMLGEESGKGFNLNLPWDLPHKYYTIGDHEYVYALERVFMPIIRKFDPELIFISAGFDSGRGDPLGGLDLTPEGFAYMMKRLLEIAPTRTIVALEGGYNLETISESAEACLRVLLGEKLPLISSETGRSMEEMKNECCPNKVALETVKRAVEVFSEYWPIVKEDKEALDFEKQVLSNSEENNAIAAGHPDYVILKQHQFLKRAKQNEIDMYEQIFSEKGNYIEENKMIQRFIPSYYGTVQLEHTYLIIENFLYKHSKASILDLKLGRVTYPLEAPADKKEKCIAKEKLTTSGELGFRISGMILKDKNGKVLEKGSRHQIYFGITPENLPEYIEKFLKSNESPEINQEALKYFLGFVDELTNFFENHSRRSWIGSSILFLLDNTNNYYKASWIDIGHAYPLEENQKDENVIFGLHNIQKILKTFLK